MNPENTLWMGGILPNMTEQQIINSFKYFQFFPTNVKFIKDKQKNKNKSYCFISFKSDKEAYKALCTLNGQKIPNTEIVFNLNWADNQSTLKTIYVGGLNLYATHEDLYLLFASKYKSIHSAKIIKENGISKGYGFVYFKDNNDYFRALNEMNGCYFFGNKIKVNEQTKKDEDRNNKTYNPGFNNKKNKNRIKNKEINNSNIINIGGINNIINKINNNIVNNNVNNFNQNIFINIKDNYTNLNNDNLLDIDRINKTNIVYGNNYILNNLTNNNNNLVETNNNLNLFKNLNNLNSISNSNNLFNKKNSSSFFLYNNNNQINNVNIPQEQHLSLGQEQKDIANTTNALTKKELNKKSGKETKNGSKLKNNNKLKKKYKLEILDKIDEITLNKKIHESILRTHLHIKKQFEKTGNKFICKYKYI